MSTIEELGFPAPEPESVQTPEPIATPEPQPTEQAAEVPRDERGRFAPRPEDVERQAPAPEDGRQRPPEGYVPVSVVQRLREENRELRQRQQPMQPQQQPMPQQVDPRANMTPQQRVEYDYQQQILNSHLNSHEYSARTRYGDGLIDAAQGWFEELVERDPASAFAIRNAPFPYEELVQHFQAEIHAHNMMRLMQQGFDPTDPDKWALERARALAAQQQAPPPQPMPNAPRSIAGIPSAGGGAGAVPVGPGQAFDSLFK